MTQTASEITDLQRGLTTTSDAAVALADVQGGKMAGEGAPSTAERGTNERGTEPGDRSTIDRGLGSGQAAGTASPDDRIAAVAERIKKVLDESGGNRNVPADVIRSILRGPEFDLSKAEVYKVLLKLQPTPYIGKLLGLFPYPRRKGEEPLGRFLLRCGVPWGFIYDNLEEWSWADTSDFFIGYVAGAGENAVEMAEGIIILAANTVLDLLAAAAGKAGIIDEEWEKSVRAKPQAFFAALHEFLRDPMTHFRRELLDKYDDAIMQLDFMEAGRIFAKITILLLTIPSALKSLYHLSRGGLEALGRVTGISIQRVTLAFAKLEATFGRDLLEQLLQARNGRIQGPHKLVLAAAGENVYVLGEDGAYLGESTLNDIRQGLQSESRGVSRGTRGGGQGRGLGRPTEIAPSRLQAKYAARAATVYPDRLWAVIEALEESYPGLKKLNLRPWRRPRITDEWVFQERMMTDQGSHSLAGRLDGGGLQLDGIDNGWILEQKLRTGSARLLVEEAEDAVGLIERGEQEAVRAGLGQLYPDWTARLLEQIRRQLEIASRTGLKGVRVDAAGRAAADVERLAIENGLFEHARALKVSLEIRLVD